MKLAGDPFLAVSDLDDHRNSFGTQRALVRVLSGCALDVLEPAEPRNARQLLRLGVAADDRDSADDDTAVLFDQLTSQLERTSRGEQVVDDDDAPVLEKSAVLCLGRELRDTNLVVSFALFPDLAPDREDAWYPEARVVGERLPDGTRPDDDVGLELLDHARSSIMPAI
ncbi:MAG: hypothetical protein JWM52_94 [Candidatus Saccharibacteria bacterium]|nr:hypothetical protein [Candidatus Saccharibacteria bacterium]